MKIKDFFELFETGEGIKSLLIKSRNAKQWTD